jgi:hypothetical protein
MLPVNPLFPCAFGQAVRAVIDYCGSYVPRGPASVAAGQTHDTRIASKDSRLSRIWLESTGNFQTSAAAWASNRQEKGSFDGWPRF